MTVALALPGPLDRRSGGTRYDLEVAGAWKRSGRPVSLLELAPSFPRPSVSERADAEARLGAVSPDIPLLVDGLAYGALPEVASRLGTRRPLVALVHHPLALEGPAQADLAESERRALACAARVIATSEYTARQLRADYEVREPIVARPGARRFARGTRRPGPIRLLAVGALSERKDPRTLLRALAEVAREHVFEATLIGPPSDFDYAEKLREELSASGLGGCVRLAGAVDEARLEAAYREADLFVATPRHEGYGMAVADALASGLPVLCTAAGALQDLVPRDWQTPVGDPFTFADQLERFLSREDARAEATDASRRAGQALPTWDESAAIIADTLSEAHG